MADTAYNTFAIHSKSEDVAKEIEAVLKGHSVLFIRRMFYHGGNPFDGTFVIDIQSFDKVSKQLGKIAQERGSIVTSFRKGSTGSAIYQWGKKKSLPSQNIVIKRDVQRARGRHAGKIQKT
jgi:hypothetical protein